MGFRVRTTLYISSILKKTRLALINSFLYAHSRSFLLSISLNPLFPLEILSSSKYPYAYSLTVILSQHQRSKTILCKVFYFIYNFTINQNYIHIQTYIYIYIRLIPCIIRRRTFISTYGYKQFGESIGAGQAWLLLDPSRCVYGGKTRKRSLQKLRVSLIF